MIFLIIALSVVLVLWLLTMFMGKREKKRRDHVIKQHLEEKKKQEDSEGKSPFND